MQNNVNCASCRVSAKCHNEMEVLNVCINFVLFNNSLLLSPILKYKWLTQFLFWALQLKCVFYIVSVIYHGIRRIRTDNACVSSSGYNFGRGLRLIHTSPLWTMCPNAPPTANSQRQGDGVLMSRVAVFAVVQHCDSEAVLWQICPLVAPNLRYLKESGHVLHAPGFYLPFFHHLHEANWLFTARTTQRECS